MKNPTHKPDNSGSSHEAHETRSAKLEHPPRPTFTFEALEPRILLSATWVGTEAGDQFMGNAADDDAVFGLGGNDNLHGHAGNDLLDGGSGDDLLVGGPGDDILISGGGRDNMQGNAGDDIFRFTGVQAGDSLRAHGAAGYDTLDFSDYAANQVADDGSTVTVNMGGGQAFTVQYSNIESILTGPASAGNTSPSGSDGSVSVNEYAAAPINLSGTDLDASDSVEQYRIESLPEDGTLKLDGTSVNANDVVTPVQVSDGQLTFEPDQNRSGSTSFGFRGHDGEAWSDNAGTSTIDVNAVNDAPVAGASADQTVDALASVTLDASGSSDVEGNALTHSWRQVDGPAVSLSDPSADQPSFVAPDVSGPTTLTLQVDASDGQSTASDTVSVLVNPVAPVGSPPPAPPVTPPPIGPAFDVMAGGVKLSDGADFAAPEDTPLANPGFAPSQATDEANAAAVTNPPGETVAGDEARDAVAAGATTGATMQGPMGDEGMTEADTPGLNQNENLNVLDPMEDLAGAVEVTELEHDAVNLDFGPSYAALSDALPAGFEPWGTVELPRFDAPDTDYTLASPADTVETVAGTKLSPVEGATPSYPSPTLASADHGVGPAGPGPLDSHARRPEGTQAAGPEEAWTRSGRTMEDTAEEFVSYDPEGRGNPSASTLAATMGFSGTALGGFLARLWGAVRGLGSTGRRTNVDSEESDRPPRKA